MTFAELVAEVFLRGASYLDQDEAGRARVKRWVNLAYLEINDLDRWPFRQAVATGAPPLTISDLGEIEEVQVTDQSYRSLSTKRRDLIDQGDLAATGSPNSYYVTGGNTVTTFPVGGNLSVRYWKVPAELVADGDVPIFPARFHYLIVEGAMRRVYLDSDNVALAEVARQEMLGGVDLMRQTLGMQAESDRILVVDSGEW